MSAISGGMFSIKYQLFLNDLYYFNSVELLTVCDGKIIPRRYRLSINN